MAAKPRPHVAIDLGASGGRVALGRIENGRLQLELLHRFPNAGVPLGESLYWDVLGLWREVMEGLRRAAEHGRIASVGVTTWGLDYALLDVGGGLLDMPHHYRDHRNAGMLAGEIARMPRERLYELTGIQFLDFNTLFQLRAHERQMPGILSRADRMLMMPDLFHYWLSGIRAAERSVASTSQMYDPRRRIWAPEVLGAFAIPPALMPRLIDPGSVLGPLRREVAAATGLTGVLVIAPAAHDTASAVAAVPAVSERPWAYVSSGTWSLVGIECSEPVITGAARTANLTNEVGFGDKIRLLKNLTGLWLLQECRRAWDCDYAALYEAAAETPACAVVDPDDARFVAPGTDMPDRIAAWCQDTGQDVPRDRGAIARTILESLALKTAVILDEIATVCGQRPHQVHVVGGGAGISLLNALLARACGVPVMAGPVEATSVGNLLMQAAAMGGIAPGTLRQIVRTSTSLVCFEPDAVPRLAMDVAAYRTLIAAASPTARTRGHLSRKAGEVATG